MDTGLKPSLTGGSHTLPFEKLAPLDFERLCLWLVAREGYERAEHLGEAGSEGGRDVVAWKSGRRVVFQCKRVKAFTAAHARVEIEKLRRLPAEEQPQELVFVVSQAVSAKTRRAAVAAWGDGNSCQFWAGSELDRQVKQHQDLLEEFFQLPTGGWRSASARGSVWSWGVGISLLGVVLTLAAWLWPMPPEPDQVKKILLVARDAKERPLGGFQFAYEGGKSLPTSEAGATELNLPPRHAPGQKIKILLLSAPKREEDWFLVNPLVNIPVPSISAEVVLMPRGEFRALAAKARDAASRAGAGQGEKTVEERKRALLEVATHYSLTAEQLDTAIRSFAETQDLEDKATAAYLEGNYSKAEALFNEAAESKTTDLVETLRYLGVSQYEQAKYSAAATTFRKALALRGEDASLLSWLGSSLHELAQWAQAEQLERRALVLNESSLGLEHPEVAVDLNNLALLLRDTNRLAEAEPLMRRALAINERSFGPDAPEVATNLNNLATLLKDLNHLVEAELLIRRALAVSEKHFGLKGPGITPSLNNLAQLLMDTNRLAEAELLMRRVLSIDEASLGQDHPDVAVGLNNLAMLLHYTNRSAQAESLMRRALKIDERCFGPEHPQVAQDLNNLAQLFESTNRRAKAEPLMRRVVTILERSLGQEHPDVATALGNLAQLLYDTNRLAEAEPLMRRSLAIDEASFGPEHPEVATSLNNLALLLQATGRLSEAEALMHRVLIIFFNFSRRTGHEHPHLQVVYGSYRALLEEMGRSDAEIEVALETLRVSGAASSTQPE